MQGALRAVAVALAAASATSGCGPDKVYLADHGYFELAPTADDERNLRDYLVIELHADEEDGECIAADVFKNPPEPDFEGVRRYYVDELAVSLARCNVDLKDLWRVRTDN